MKPTKGGKRAGSGRKPRIVPRVPITVRLEPSDAKAFWDACKRAQLSQSAMIVRMIREKEANL